MEKQEINSWKLSSLPAHPYTGGADPKIPLRFFLITCREDADTWPVSLCSEQVGSYG